MSSNFQLIKSTQFNGLAFDCYKDTDTQNSSSKEFWATREQIGRLLGYEDPVDAIKKIHKRNSERLDKFSRGDKMSLVEGERTVVREVTIYSFKGLLEICRCSNQPKAHQVIDFLWDIADEIRLTGSYNAPKGNVTLEAARLLQHMIDNPAYQMTKRSRESVSRYIFKLITGEDLDTFTENDQAELDSKHSEEIFSNIKRLRKALHLTQEALASLLGIHRNTVGRWENGIQKPNEELQSALAKLFNRPIEEILSNQ